jgi:hypothetical protein
MASHAKYQDSDSGIEHLERVLNLARSLQKKGLSLYEHHWDCLAFGGWTITAGRRKDCFEFSWDGRDFFLQVSHSTDINSALPQTWKPIENHRLSPDDGFDPIQFIDDFFEKRSNQSPETRTTSGPVSA